MLFYSFFFYTGNSVAHYDDQSKSIQHNKCNVLTEGNSICQECKQYKKNTLLRQIKRINKENEEQQCDPQSHTNYRFLTSRMRG